MIVHDMSARCRDIVKAPMSVSCNQASGFSGFTEINHTHTVLTGMYVSCTTEQDKTSDSDSSSQCCFEIWVQLAQKYLLHRDALQKSQSTEIEANETSSGHVG